MGRRESVNKHDLRYKYVLAPLTNTYTIFSAAFVDVESWFGDIRIRQQIMNCEIA